jgi:hypothetical protein
MNRQQTPEAYIILLEKNTEYRYFVWSNDYKFWFEQESACQQTL